MKNKTRELALVDALAGYCENDECKYGDIDDPDPDCGCDWCAATRLVRETEKYPDHRMKAWLETKE